MAEGLGIRLDGLGDVFRRLDDHDNGEIVRTATEWFAPMT